jgi:hypothetical protein
MDPDEDINAEGSDVENDNIDDANDQNKQEYVKKEYFAQPYVSPWNTDNEVRAMATKNSR